MKQSCTWRPDDAVISIQQLERKVDVIECLREDCAHSTYFEIGGLSDERARARDTAALSGHCQYTEFTRSVRRLAGPEVVGNRSI